MQVSRVVKIAVNDKDSIWKDLSKVVFSDFIFRIPGSLSSKTYKEDGANVLLEFIPESSELLQYAQIGNDPYERPYLYLYVIKVKSNKDLKEEIIHTIQHWVAAASMIGTQWRVIIFQEEASFFDSSKQINRSMLVPEPSMQQNVVVIQCKKKQKMTDQTVEIIKSTIRFALIESFDSFESEAVKKIKQMKTGFPQLLVEKLKAWHALLLLYYGFTEEALIEFKETYKSIMPLINDPLSMKLTPINTNFITNYPFDDMNDLYAVMFFCLHGAMSVHYTKTRFIEMVDMFLMHLGFLSELCESRKQLLVVEEWAEESLKALLAIPDFASTTPVLAKILERLFYLQIQRNSMEAAATRTKLLNVLPMTMKYSRAAIDSKFTKWADIHNMPLPTFHENAALWRIGARAASIFLEDSISKGRKVDIEKYSVILLNDKSIYEDKADLVNRLMQMPSRICLVSPFNISPLIESPSFGGLVQQGTMTEITIKIKLPQWFTQTITDFDIEISHENGISQNEIIINPDVTKAMKVQTFFMAPGKWEITKLSWKVGMMEFNFPFSDDFTKLEVVPLENPKVDIQLPLLVSLWKSMKIGISADFSKILEKDISMNVSFSGDSIKIPPQKGKAYADDKQVSYVFDEKGNLTFVDSQKEEERFVLAQHTIKFQLDFQMIKQAETTDIIATTDISGVSFEQRNHVSFKFPIECRIRHQTEDFIHICLHNTSDIDLTIESAEVMPDAWGKMDLKAGCNVFLLARHIPDTDTVLNVFVSEPHGSSIANSWNLREQSVGSPIIDVDISDSVFIEGEPTQVSFELPECFYKIQESKDVVFAGCVSRKFKGGTVTFTMIPLRQGCIKMPSIIINNVSHEMNPMFITVEHSSIPVMTPLVKC